MKEPQRISGLHFTRLRLPPPHMQPPVTDINDSVVRQLPAAVQPEHVEGVALLRREVTEGGVGDVVGLKGELVEGGQQLGDGADRLVRHVYAVGQGEGHYAGVEAGPETGLGYLVAACQLQLVEGLEWLGF